MSTTLSDFVWILLLVLLFPFAYVLLLGAPYLPTKKRLLLEFIDSLNPQPGSKIIDLGSGDGRLLKDIAINYKMHSVGYELNPLLVVLSKLITIRHRSFVKIIFADFWKQDIPSDTDFVYVFLLPRYMQKLRQKIESEIDHSVTVITYAFEFTDLKPTSKLNGFLAYKLQPAKEKSNS